MNRQLARLFSIAKQESRTILGLMSGTSLDGLDVAVCKISGSGASSKLKVLRFQTMPYSNEFTTLVRRVFAKDQIRQTDLSGLHVLIADTHALLVTKALQDWGIQPINIDFIASHGQTVFHAPHSQTADRNYPNHTLQIGDGDHLAVKTGIITISDFRQKHVAAGGEGAPLALYGDFLLFSDPDESRVLLNMGGIANFTFLPSKQCQAAGHGAFASDTGTANTLMNQYMQKHFGLSMDEEARIALQGRVHEPLLNSLLDDPFFIRPLPKTTGPELFNLEYLHRAMERANCIDLKHEHVMATLCAFSAQGISKAIRTVVQNLPYGEQVQIYASGGGLSNPLLMKQIKQSISQDNLRIQSFAELGLDPDAKEAALFAVLANETVVGQPEHVRGLNGAPAVCMGKISLPS